MSLPNQESGRPREDRYYPIFLKMVPEKPLTPEVVNLHAAHLENLDKDGKLLLTGPILVRAGGLIVLRAQSIAEAKAVAEEDPMIRGGYQSYEFGTWTMSCRQNNYRPNP